MHWTSIRFSPLTVGLLGALVACSSGPAASNEAIDGVDSTQTNTALGSGFTSATVTSGSTSGGTTTSSQASSVGSVGSGGPSATSTTNGGGSLTTAGDSVTGVGGQSTTTTTTTGATNATASTDGSTSGGEPDEFPRPVGTIPNQPQPGSTVDLPKSEWEDGLVSPTLLKGHQINQPGVINGHLVVAGNEEFWIYDVSTPSSPQLLSSFTSPNHGTGEAESHTLSFARYGDKFYMVTIRGTGIDTWDVTTPTAPQHLAQLPVPGTSYGDYTEAIWGVAWQGQYIYVGATNNGIKVVDAADPAAPSIVAEVSTSQYGGVSAGPVEAIGNVLVVMTPKESGGVATLDISDPLTPTRLASFSAEKSYIGQFYRHWVFLITPLRVWDVLSDPRSIGSGSSPLGTLNHEGAEYLSFQDDYLFLGHVRTEISGTPGASKISVANPSAMSVESRIWGRLDPSLNGLNDDQFTLPIGNLLVLGDDQAPYAGWVIAAHQTDPDTTAPVVDTVIPKPESSGNSTKSRIGISLSDNIELATVNPTSFIVRPVGGEPLAGRYGVRMGVLNFDPNEDLQPGTTYEVVLPAGGITDLVGNSLAAEWKSTFSTN